MSQKCIDTARFCIRKPIALAPAVPLLPLHPPAPQKGHFWCRFTLFLLKPSQVHPPAACCGVFGQGGGGFGMGRDRRPGRLDEAEPSRRDFKIKFTIKNCIKNGKKEGLGRGILLFLSGYWDRRSAAGRIRRRPVLVRNGERAKGPRGGIGPAERRRVPANVPRKTSATRSLPRRRGGPWLSWRRSRRNWGAPELRREPVPRSSAIPEPRTDVPR